MPFAGNLSNKYDTVFSAEILFYVWAIHTTIIDPAVIELIVLTNTANIRKSFPTITTSLEILDIDEGPTV